MRGIGGSAIREAETFGIPWAVDETKSQHQARAEDQTSHPNRSICGRGSALLLFTGCRLREILHLRWEYVDIERGCLFLPDSKSGRKTVILNAPALAVLNAQERISPYVVPGDDVEQPRHGLKRPWDAVTKQAGLTGVHLHDLRHTYASSGAAGGLGLPIIGRLLGHAQIATSARYTHLEHDPLRRASEAIAGRIAAALDGNKTASIGLIQRIA